MHYSHKVKTVMRIIPTKVIYLRQKAGSDLQNPATLSKHVSSSKL